MALYDEYLEARRAEASGTAGGTRGTYLEWLNEKQLLVLRGLVYLLTEGLRGESEEVEDAGPEDEDGAPAVRLAD